jgi:hypothetical protein
MSLKNITIITSIIDTCKKGFSYSDTRSFWTKEERFEQTKKTIYSVKKYIPNNKILVIECSLLTSDERCFFQENTDYFLNLYDLNDKIILEKINSPSKSIGEGTMTTFGLDFLLNNNIEFDNLFKLSGRYWLNDNFNYNFYDNNFSSVCKIYDNFESVFTCLYKLNKEMTKNWLEYLKNSENEFINCVGYENIFGSFTKSQKMENYLFMVRPLGVNGFISIANEYIDV